MCENIANPLPPQWLCKRPLCISHCRGELASCQHTLTNRFYEVNCLRKRIIWPRTVSHRTKQSHLLFQFIAYYPNRREQVSIVRNHYRRVILVTKGICQQMGCEIHVGTLFFRLHNRYIRINSGRRIAQTHLYIVGIELPKDDFKAWNRVEGTKKQLLPCTLTWISRARFYCCREVFNLLNVECPWRKRLTHRAQVEPLMWRPLQNPIIQIESVNVNATTYGHKNAKAESFRNRPRVQPPKGTGGICTILTPAHLFVNRTYGRMPATTSHIYGRLPATCIVWLAPMAANH